MFSFPSLLAGSGPRHDPCPSARPGEPGEGCGRGRPGCEQAGRAATCAAERPCRPVGRVPWGEGAALPRRPAQRGMLANGRRRSARAIVTRSAETGPGLREGLQPRVERGRPWPARPTLRTRIALGRSTAIARTSTVFAPEMLVRPQRAPGAGDDGRETIMSDNPVLSDPTRTRHPRRFCPLSRAQSAVAARVNTSASDTRLGENADRHRTRRPVISRTADFEGCPRRLAYVWRAREKIRLCSRGEAPFSHSLDTADDRCAFARGKRSGRASQAVTEPAPARLISQANNSLSGLADVDLAGPQGRVPPGEACYHRNAAGFHTGQLQGDPCVRRKWPRTRHHLRANQNSHGSGGHCAPVYDRQCRGGMWRFATTCGATLARR